MIRFELKQIIMRGKRFKGRELKVEFGRNNRSAKANK
jgi:hypothetical protein